MRRGGGGQTGWGMRARVNVEEDYVDIVNSFPAHYNFQDVICLSDRNLSYIIWAFQFSGVVTSSSMKNGNERKGSQAFLMTDLRNACVRVASNDYLDGRLPENGKCT